MNSVTPALYRLALCVFMLPGTTWSALSVAMNSSGGRSCFFRSTLITGLRWKNDIADWYSGRPGAGMQYRS